MQDEAGTRRRPSAGDITAAAVLAWGAMSERASVRRGLLAAIPVIGVNIVAFYGQLSYLGDHLAAPAAIRVLVAAVLEAIAVYLAWMAHLAQLSGDSAFRLRLASYFFALIIAAMNYSHFAGLDGRLTFTAAAFALCSAVSPWLWAVYSRRESRDELRRRGDIEPHAVRLGATRWAWHPLRSARVMSRASWLGVAKPAEAIKLIDAPDWAPGPGSQHDVRSGSIPAGVPEYSPAGEPPPSDPSRREPRRAVTEQREAREGAQGLAAASSREQQVLAELLEEVAAGKTWAGKPWPSERELSREKFGVIRTGAARDVLQRAKAQLNGSGPV
jgi:hypothetical protein